MSLIPNDWRPALVAGGGAFIVATAGGLATRIGPWYDGLAKPGWQPPDWLFGPTWTVIFALIAVAGWQAWRVAPDHRARATVLVAFAVNGGLNVLWSVLFFTLKRPDWALVEVVILWFSIVVLVMVVTPLSRLAGWLLVPYLTWVTFAGVLNLEIVQLNGPFGRS